MKGRLVALLLLFAWPVCHGQQEPRKRARDAIQQCTPAASSPSAVRGKKLTEVTSSGRTPKRSVPPSSRAASSPSQPSLGMCDGS